MTLLTSSPASPTAASDPSPLLGSVLVLDDFPDAADALCEWLKLNGWDAHAATTVDEALARIHTALPSVVVMDPELRSGGAMRFATVAHQMAGRRVLLVALTPWTQLSDEFACGPTLFDMTLQKPVDGFALHECLKALTATVV